MRASARTVRRLVPDGRQVPPAVLVGAHAFEQGQQPQGRRSGGRQRRRGVGQRDAQGGVPSVLPPLRHDGGIGPAAVGPAGSGVRGPVQAPRRPARAGQARLRAGSGTRPVCCASDVLARLPPRTPSPSRAFPARPAHPAQPLRSVGGREGTVRASRSGRRNSLGADRCASWHGRSSLPALAPSRQRRASVGVRAKRGHPPWAVRASARSSSFAGSPARPAPPSTLPKPCSPHAQREPAGPGQSR